LIEKRSKNVIQWKGGPRMGTMSPEEAGKLFDLKLELTDLERDERNMDTHLKWLKQSLGNVSEFRGNNEYAYTKSEEIEKCFQDQTTVAIIAPPGTRVEVPLPSRHPETREPRYKMRLTSVAGPINVMLVNPGDRLGEEGEGRNGELKSKKEMKRTHPYGQELVEVVEEEQRNMEALLRLSPPPSDKDYILNLNQGETLDELFNPEK